MSKQSKGFSSATITVVAMAITCVCSAEDRTRPAVIAEPSLLFSPRVLRLDQVSDEHGILASTRGADHDADFLRLRLIVIAPTPLSHATITVTDDAGKQTDLIDLNGLSGVREVWTRIIPGNRFLLTVSGQSQPSGSTVSVWQMLRNVTPPQALSIVQGHDDREAMASVTDPTLRAAGRAVVKLLFQIGYQTYSCTGFLIKPDKVVTNEHCIATSAACDTTAVLFDYDSVTMVPAAQQRRCMRVLQVDHTLDYSALQLDAPADRAIQPLAFGQRSPAPNERLILIEHPGGEPKQVSRTVCKAAANPVRGNGTNTDFTHTCATLNGSSGSPVLDALMHVVGLHHFGIGDDEPTYNRAVRVEPIAQSLVSSGILQ